MAKSKKRVSKKSQGTKKSLVNSSLVNSLDIPGLRILEDGAVGFDNSNLPASSHYFDATHFALDVSGENFVILFGQKSNFSTDDKYNLAVEIAMPKEYANKFLFEAIHKINSLGHEKPFIEVVNEHYEKLKSKDSDDRSKPLKLPDDSNSFRRFSSNFSTISISGGQALIEFFEVPPDLLVSVVHSRNVRKGAGAQSIVSVVTNVSLLKLFLDKTKISINEGGENE